MLPKLTLVRPPWQVRKVPTPIILEDAEINAVGV